MLEEAREHNDVYTCPNSFPAQYCNRSMMYDVTSIANFDYSYCRQLIMYCTKDMLDTVRK